MKIQSAALYIGDNGRVLCGAHLGATARMTGRDLSGQRIEQLERPHADEAARMGFPLECETCGAPYREALA